MRTQVVSENGRSGSCEKILNTTLLRSWLGNSSLLRKNLLSRECERAVAQPNFSQRPVPGFLSVSGFLPSGFLFPTWFKAVLLGLWMATCPISHAQEQPASELVGFFASRSDGPVIFTCGRARVEDEKNRSVADALVKLGDSAIPDLEVAFDSIEERGRESAFGFNAGWLLEAYARIKGPAAFAGLQRMRSSQKTTFLQGGLDHSTALSLGLTSYVSSSGVLAEKANCNGSVGPRDLLDQFILAWERNDRQWVERSLSPGAKAALGSLLNGRTWDRMRAELWHGKSGDGFAVGYRFDASGWSSASREPITVAARNPVNPEIYTIFTNSAGRDCGSHLVMFLKTDEGDELTYPIDNSDLGGLLRLISYCAQE